MSRAHLLASTLATLTLALGPSTAHALPVSLELVLLADVSGSLSESEFELQRTGYADAFRNPAIQNLISNTPGGIAVTLVYWAAADVGGGFSEGIQEQKIGWTHLASGADAMMFATLIDLTDRSIDIGGGSFITGGQTAVASALDFGTGLLLADNGFEADRLIIDISGDGFENVDFNPAGCDAGFASGCVDQGFDFGPPELDAGLIYTDPTLFFEDVIAARDAAVAAGITINGAAITLDHLDLGSFFYAPHVTGGSGSFVMTANDFEAFGDTIAAKLALELPEPGAVILMGLGLAGLAFVRRAPRERTATRPRPPARAGRSAPASGSASRA